MAGIAQPVGVINSPLLAYSNPKAAGDQLAIQRQQALAQQLIDQGSQQQDPAQLANPGGLVVPVSPWAALGKALETGVGHYQQAQADNAQRDLYAQIAAKLQSQNPATNPQNGQPLPWQDSMTADNLQEAQGNQQKIADALVKQGQNGQQAPKDNNLLNDPQYMRDAMIAGPEEAYKNWTARTAIPEPVKIATFANGGDQSKAAAALRAKEIAEAEVSRRPHSLFSNPLTGESGIVPSIPAGANANMNGTNVASISPIPITPPGQPPAAPAAPMNGPAITSTDIPPPAVVGGRPQAPDNMDSILRNYQSSNGAPDSAMPNAIPGTTPGVPQAAPAPSALPKDFPLPAPPAQMTITPVETEAAKKSADATQQRNSDILTAAGSSPTRYSDLQKIYGLASAGTKFGPGADKASYYKALAQQIPGIQIEGPEADAVNYEVAKKYFSNLSGQYQKALDGTGTDKQLDIAMSGTPGPDMLNSAIKKVAPFLMGQEKALQAQANMRRAVTNPNGGYGKNATQDLQNMEDYWQKNYDPDAFELAAIPPEGRADFIKSLSPADAARLGGDGKKNKGSYQKALEAGWIQ